MTIAELRRAVEYAKRQGDRYLWADAALLRRLLAGEPPDGLRYECGCGAVRSAKVMAFCPEHLKPLPKEAP